jgi:hypothetical protein
VNDNIGTHIFYQANQCVAIPNIDGFVPICGNLPAQPRQRPTRIALRAEKHGAVIAVDTRNTKALLRKKNRNFRPNETAGTGDENRLVSHLVIILRVETVDMLFSLPTSPINIGPPTTRSRGGT